MFSALSAAPAAKGAPVKAAPAKALAFSFYVPRPASRGLTCSRSFRLDTRRPLVGRRRFLVAHIGSARWDPSGSKSICVPLQSVAGLSSHAVTKLRPDDHDRDHDQLQHDPGHRAPVDVASS